MSGEHLSAGGLQPDAPLGEVYHGSIDAGELQRLGIDPDHVIDFSSNINPFGPSPRVGEAVQQTPLDRYPDRHCTALRAAIAAKTGVDAKRIAVGNGSSELLQTTAQLLLSTGDAALILGPTYSEYERASCLAGARVHHCSAAAEDGFAVPLDSFDRDLRRLRPRAAFLCNPNNPTGQVVDRGAILHWAQTYRDTCFVVDESYIDFAQTDCSVVATELPNLIVLRSMTKSYALAGLRLGYVIADAGVIRELCRRRVPWNVSAPAQAAGVAAIEDQAHLRDCLFRLHDAKQMLLAELSARQIDIVASDANFMLLRLGDAATMRSRLLSYNLLVRDCSSFGLPDHARVSVRSEAENAILAQRLSLLRS